MRRQLYVCSIKMVKLLLSENKDGNFIGAVAIYLYIHLRSCDFFILRNVRVFGKMVIVTVFNVNAATVAVDIIAAAIVIVIVQSGHFAVAVDISIDTVAIIIVVDIVVIHGGQ